MDYKFKYKELLNKKGINVSDLPADAAGGIKDIEDVLKGIKLVESRGKAPKSDTIKKLERLDKWVHDEIVDFLNDEEKNTATPPVDPEELKKQVKDEVVAAQKDPEVKTPEPVKAPEEKSDPKNGNVETGLKIEQELAELNKKGINEITSESLKSSAKNTYDFIFNNYESGEINGIKTSFYSLIEKKDTPHTFTLIKN